MIVNDVKSSTYFNKLVDISSILPIFAIPLVDRNDKNKCIGVIEIVLKHRYKCKNKKEELIEASDGHFGFDEPFSNVLNCFSNVLTLALRNCNFEKK